MVLTSLPTDDLTRVISALDAAGGTAVGASADVRDPSKCELAAPTALKEFGRIDFVHINAGVADQSGVANGDLGRWRRVIETNLQGARDVCGRAAYIASKWGLVGFGHALRKEVDPAGVRVTLVESAWSTHRGREAHRS
jgi:NAD(P)-dependent dehydrogenase (short-subunit alcohol dehydrogenase family)